MMRRRAALTLARWKCLLQGRALGAGTPVCRGPTKRRGHIMRELAGLLAALAITSGASAASAWRQPDCYRPLPCHKWTVAA